LEFIEEVKNIPTELPAAVSGEKTEINENTPDAEPEKVPYASEITPVVSANCKEYHIWTNIHYLNQDDFYEYSGRKIIKQQIAEIIEQEAPIYENLLKRRIARAWGFSRTGGNIQKILDACMPSDFETSLYGEDRVIWAKNQTSSEYSFYRAGNSEETKRAIDEIPPEELANAMYEVLIDFNSCEKDTLFRETVKLFGLSAVTAKARKFLEYGFTALQKSGRI
jgi:hypothetical protein